MVGYKMMGNSAFCRWLPTVFSLAILVMLPAQSHAEAGGTQAGFACTFPSGTSWSFEEGKYKSESAKAVAFEIGAIDLEKQTADLAMDGKSGGILKIVRALNANSFIEVAGEGFLNLTTIYDRDPASGVFPAVHSRHFGVLGQPVFAQYAGTCTAK